MPSARHTPRLLHEEHRAHLQLLGRVEQAFARPLRGGAPDAETSRLAATLAQQMEHEVERHFGFEERELFSRMVQAGEADIAAVLAAEHEAMRDLAAQLLPLLRQFASGVLPTSQQRALAQGALEFAERQFVHIQKEEMALLPMLEDLLDEDTDARLALDYQAS
jgi:hemerythrin-like domain-containing protein